MKNEAQFKVAWKKSVVGAKGTSISLSAPVFPGIPDMLTILPGYAPVLIEAKWLGSIERNKFARKMQYTAMQIRWIEECCAVNTYSALGLAGFRMQNEYYAVLVPYNSKYFAQLTEKFLEDGVFSRLQNGRFDVLSMFEQIPIPRLNYGPPRRIAGPGQAEDYAC